MGARGPAPQPTALRKLHGNPGKRPLPKNEPQPRRAIPPCPRHLSKKAKAEWRRVSRELYDLGLLSNVDRAALAAYCTAWARWVEAEEIVQQKGMVIKTTNGNFIQNPFLSIANRAMDDMRRLMVEFGMTPASRTRVQVQKETTVDEFTAFLQKRQGTNG